MNVGTYLNFILALIAVLALIGIAAWVWRRLALGGRLPGMPGPANRIRIIESRAIDARRRCVLIGCDNREYLVLLSPQTDLLIAGLTDGPTSSAPTTKPDVGA